MKQEFKTITELLDFVLTECGEMIFSVDYDSYNDRTSLIIISGFDAERIYYANVLLRKHFDISISSLNIQTQISEIEGDWLSKMQIRELLLPDSIEKMPKLPRCIESIDYQDMVLVIKDKNDNNGTGSYWQLDITKYDIGRSITPRKLFVFRDLDGHSGIDDLLEFIYNEGYERR